MVEMNNIIKKVVKIDKIRFSLDSELKILTNLIRKFYKGKNEIHASMVDGDGLVVVFNDSDDAPISCVISIIKRNGFFTDNDLKNLSF